MPNNPKKVVIVGGGDLGAAFAAVLKTTADIRIWDKEEGKRVNAPSQSLAAEGADIAIFSVPSWAVRAAAADIIPRLSPSAILISCAKGIEEDSLMTADAVLRDSAAGRSVVLLSGPCLAHELREGRGGSAVVACEESAPLHEVLTLFSGTSLKIISSSDIAGVAFCGVLKNVYAIALGLADGYGAGENAKAHIAGVAVREMAMSIPAIGGLPDTVFGPAGLEDLIATGYSGDSRNHEVGCDLAHTGACCLASEGYRALPALVDIFTKRAIGVPPLLSLLAGILMKGDSPETFLPRALNL